MASDRERALIRRAAEGDAKAFDRLVLRYRGLVLRIAREGVASRELAEDAAQEALPKATNAPAKWAFFGWEHGPELVK
ncbi:MAG: hypothetical protein FJX74_25715 [Armatimonadetes bacterium]|nr:hypothetical protein [Armatimonadota bacterium]